MGIRVRGGDPSFISRRALPLFPGGPFLYFPAGARGRAGGRPRSSHAQISKNRLF